LKIAEKTASTATGPELVNSLSSHLVVELSHLGNAQYRNGQLEAAISSYEEAIVLCEKTVAPGSSSAKDISAGTREGEDAKSKMSNIVAQVSESTRENMVRLRYNLARTLHRSDRWSEARRQASEVIALDHAYANAYALRAQAAMAGCDWQAALSDWDALMSIIASGSAAGGAGSHADRADLMATWRKRREECVAQLSLGHYEILNLRRIAGVSEVQQAYQELARQWHPDRHSHRSQDLQDRAHRRFERIRQAYEVLRDETSKHAYDATLLLSEARPLMTGHGATSSICAERVKASEPSEKPLSVSASTSHPRRRSSLKGGATLPDTSDNDKDQNNGNGRTAKGSRTDSPVGRNSPKHSPLSKWLPSLRQNKSGAGESAPPIHVNLFDAKYGLAKDPQ
jgi:curved DNA-binding protein CbpA